MRNEQAPEIVMYATRWCGDCNRAASYLKSHNVTFRWIDIDQDAQARAYVIELNHGYASVPTIVFPDGDILVEPSNWQLSQKLEGKAGPPKSGKENG